MRRFFRSSPSRRHRQPLHPGNPGSIHEGGELGYSLSHAFGAAFDNPDLLVAVAWWATARRKPARWPPPGIPTSSSTPAATAPCCRCCTSTATRSTTPRCWRASPERAGACCAATAGTPYFVEGSDPRHAPGHGRGDGQCHAAEIRDPGRARQRRPEQRPAAALADDRAALPKGWTGRRVDGHKVEGFWRAHQVPLPKAARTRASCSSWRLAAQLPPRGAVRRAGPAGSGAARTGPAGAAPHGRQPPCQRRPAAPQPCACRTFREAMP
jgi:xylulose-5-phosphate/fructose-6-phosphate phosphoketolase